MASDSDGGMVGAQDVVGGIEGVVDVEEEEEEEAQKWAGLLRNPCVLGVLEEGTNHP